MKNHNAKQFFPLIKLFDYLEKKIFVVQIMNSDESNPQLLNITNKRKINVNKVEKALLEIDKLFFSMVMFKEILINKLNSLTKQIQLISGERIAFFF